MKRFIAWIKRSWIKRFFLPPPGSPLWVRLLPYIVLGILTIIVLTGAAYGWEYTNSPEFCGETCHTMPPEYTAYLESPHARIDCVDCHIGKGFIATRISRKAGDLKHVFRTIFKNYEYPIRAGELRPARETCELCHSPEKFSDDSLQELKTFADDKDNSPLSTYLIMKTGGGSKRVGLGRGIHWHIENKVEFLPTDPEEQNIPYVRVTNDDGSVDEYVDVESGFNKTNLDESSLKEMDCITCHNRITHLIPDPEATVDQLMARGLISSDIPDIHREAVEVYGRQYESVDQALKGIAGIESYYSTYYPEYYAANQDKIQAAIEQLQTAYKNSVFPEQKVDWNSHPTNVGHKNSPGCFRCHDGKHLSTDGEAVRLECNLCHSVPVVAESKDFVTDIEISRGPEPESHLNTNWISMHNQAFNDTCSNCHTVEDAGGVSNTSFCSNSACHGNVWKYAGFDAPKLRQVIQAQLPPTPTPAPTPAAVETVTYENTIGPILQAKCVSCHGENGLQGLNFSTYETTMAGGVNGPVIIPGDPEGSLLIQKQSGETPHFGQLTPEELDLFIDWISNGATQK